MADFRGDRELDALLKDDPSLRVLAESARSGRPEPVLDPRFKAVLRAQLIREAPSILGKQTWWQRRRGGLAWTSIGAGAVATAAALALLVVNQVHDHSTPLAAILPGIQGQAQVNPDAAIVVGFTQPMDQASVVQALHIEPATAVTTSWNNNTLTITPLHHLTSNTPYTVTIDHSVAKASNGGTLAADVTLTFGTGTTPSPSASPSPSAPPTLQATAVIPANSDVIAFAPDGSVLTNAAAPSSGAQPSGSPFSSTTPAPTPSSVQGASASPAPSGDGLYDFPGSGSSVRIGNHAAVAAVSPNGHLVAFATTNAATNASTVTIARNDGSNAVTHATTTSPVIALTWSSNDTVIYATDTKVRSLTTAVTRGVPAASHGIAAGDPGLTLQNLSPSGHYTFEAPTGSGTVTSGALMDNTHPTRAPIVLRGSTTAAFSGDSQWIAWMDTSATPAVVMLAATDNTTAPVALSLPPGTDTSKLTSLALNRDGSEMAYVTSDGNGGSVLIVASITNQTVAVTVVGDGSARDLTFDANSDHLAYVGGDASNPLLYVAAVPNTSPASPTTNVSQAATDTITTFLAAQVGGDQAKLLALSGSGLNAFDKTPKDLTRSYLIDATANVDGSVVAQARLLRDPSSSKLTTLSADETFTLTQPNGGAGFVVSQMTATALKDQPSGPHVLHVTGSRDNTFFEITFDADLETDSVAPAITLVDDGNNGATVAVSVRYNDNTRTASMTVLGLPPTQGTLIVATTLTDLNRKHLATTFHYVLPG